MARPSAATIAAATAATIAAWALYAATLAPGLTWAHHGADGGDLLAAARTNGVPHPSGYPLYTVLLQGWLAAGQGLGISSPAWLGNSFSAFAAGLSAGMTVLAAAALLANHPRGAVWALIAGLIWAIAPLPWSQALITEVYALHGLLAALIGLATFARPLRPVWLGLILGLGLAHHLTTVLLWPALFYMLSRHGQGVMALARLAGLALGVAALCYARIPLVAGQGPPPVNWGYAVDWAGLWWLIGGEPYRAYLLALSLAELAGRVMGVGRTLVDQVTPLGLLPVVAAAMQWERRPAHRTAVLLWVLPLSGYAAAYVTVDSQVYLLPVVWLVALWAAQGLALADRALEARRAARMTLVGLTLVGLATLTAWRVPMLSLRHDDEAMRYLAAAAAVITPGSLVISSADAQTFTLWYGAWASEELAADTVLLNADLYRFGWYRRLMHDLYPEVAALGAPLADVIAANRATRPIFYTEPELAPAAAELVPAGPLWRMSPP